MIRCKHNARTARRAQAVLWFCRNHRSRVRRSTARSQTRSRSRSKTSGRSSGAVYQEFLDLPLVFDLDRDRVWERAVERRTRDL